jgi:hypothetical protein
VRKFGNKFASNRAGQLGSNLAGRVSISSRKQISLLVGDGVVGESLRYLAN